MKNTIFKAIAVFMIFFLGTCGLIAVDTICNGYTGEGGKLVLDVENMHFFN